MADESFTGACPTCGQAYLAARLATANQRAENAEGALVLAQRAIAAAEARLAEAAVKVNNVAECLAYGMDPKACEAELRLIAKGAGYGPADSASGAA